MRKSISKGYILNSPFNITFLKRQNYRDGDGLVFVGMLGRRRVADMMKEYKDDLYEGGIVHRSESLLQ